jgi:hypothetical protein
LRKPLKADRQNYIILSEKRDLLTTDYAEEELNDEVEVPNSASERHLKVLAGAVAKPSLRS